MHLDEIVISRAITETFMKDFNEALDVDVAIVGAGPAGMVAAYYLAKAGIKTVIFERALRVGGGMPGGGMMFNYIVVQEEGKKILDELDVDTKLYKKGYYTADAVEATATICSKTVKAGAKIFNLISVEDVMIREEDKVTGLVLNWSATEIAKLHVDPLSMRSKLVIDASGHASEVCNIVVRKIGPKLRTPSGKVEGEKPMWADVAENMVKENTCEIYPGLIIAGMAANAVKGTHRMGPIFGGMLISGKRAAELAMEILSGK
jgi:sulfide-dependent adenosine diphosphate thiazole synthase